MTTIKELDALHVNGEEYKLPTYTAGDRVDITNNVISADKQFEVVSTLPSLAQASEDKVYILGPLNVNGEDKYEEWIKTDQEPGFISESGVTHVPVDFESERDGYRYRCYFTEINELQLDEVYYGVSTTTVTGVNENEINLGLFEGGDSTAYYSYGMYGSSDLPWMRTTDEEEPGTAYGVINGSAVSNVGNFTGHLDFYYSSTPMTWSNGGKVWKKIGETSIDLTDYAQKSEVLTKTNTEAFTPTGDYQPATKKYVDDNKGKNDIVITDNDNQPPTDPDVLWKYHVRDGSGRYAFRYYDNMGERCDIESIHYSSSSPSYYNDGDLRFDETNKILKYYDPSSYEWKPVGPIEYAAGPGITIGDYIESPVEIGYHIATPTDWNSIRSALSTLGLPTTGNTMKTYFKIPFAGCRNFNSNISNQGSYGYYRTSARSSNNHSSVTEFSSSNYGTDISYNRGYGLSLRCFKDNPVIPDNNWTTLYDGSSIAQGAGIFYNSTLGLISISKDGTNRYTLKDKNEGATTVYSDGDTLSEDNCGKYYQWGNCYGFPRTGTITNTSSTRVNASGYGPGNYYSSDTWISQTYWDNSNNSKLWNIRITHNTISADTSFVQEKLTAGNNITITNNTISSTDTTYSEGNGIDINANNEISVDSSIVALKSDLANYYTKTETYTKTEVENLIANIGSFEVVATLPSASTADTTKIYLLGPIGTGADKYEEWIVTDQPGGHFESDSEITHELITSTYDGDFTIFDEDFENDPIYIGITNLELSNSGIWVSDGGGSCTCCTIESDTTMPWIGNGNDCFSTEGYEYPKVHWLDSVSYGDTVSFDLYYSHSPLTWVGGSTVKGWTKIGETTPDLSNYITTNQLAAQVSTLNASIDTKQDKLKAGNNITISYNTVSARDTLYSGGKGIEIINDCSAVKCMAPNGFHIPTGDELKELVNIWEGLGGTDSYISQFQQAFKLPKAGHRFYQNGDVSSAGLYGFYRSSDYNGPRNGYMLVFYNYKIYVDTGGYPAYGNSIRCFKDNPVIPTSSWTKLYGNSIKEGGTFWNQTDGIISCSRDGKRWITIADKNLGATQVWNSGNTLTEANCGKFYQFGNCYGFPWSGSLSDTTSTKIDPSEYGPNNLYYNDAFYIGSMRQYEPQNYNIWGGETGIITNIINATYTAGNGINIDANNEISVDASVVALKSDLSNKQDVLTAGTNIQIDQDGTISATDTTYDAGKGIAIGTYNDYSAMQGPCPNGFHIPLNTEWQAVKDIWTSLGGGNSDGTNFGIAIKMPFAGRLGNGSATHSGANSWITCWSSVRYNSGNAYALYLTSSLILLQNNVCAGGHSIRGFKDTPVVPTSSWTKLYGTSIEAGGIFWSSTDGLISLSSDGQTWITMADKNLGATQVWNSGDTLSESNCGKFYQWGNNYGFSFNGASKISSTKVNVSSYGPGNYYSSSTFITSSGGWDNPENYNLWGGKTGIIVHKEISNALPGPIVSATAPSNPSEGDTWYDTTNDIFKTYDGTNWNVTSDFPGMTILSYGHNTWQDFLDAYNRNAIVYCRASSNSNPGTGVQGRMAFMAFIGFSGTTPTNVEFQYYRSRSDHNSQANELDEVYVYKLENTKGGKWTVTQRNTAAKTVAGTGISLTFGSGNMVINNTLPFNPASAGTTGQALKKTASGYDWADNGSYELVTQLPNPANASTDKRYLLQTSVNTDGTIEYEEYIIKEGPMFVSDSLIEKAHRDFEVGEYRCVFYGPQNKYIGINNFTYDDDGVQSVIDIELVDNDSSTDLDTIQVSDTPYTYSNSITEPKFIAVSDSSREPAGRADLYFSDSELTWSNNAKYWEKISERTNKLKFFRLHGLETTKEYGQEIVDCILSKKYNIVIEDGDNILYWYNDAYSRGASQNYDIVYVFKSTYSELSHYRKYSCKYDKEILVETDRNNNFYNISTSASSCDEACYLDVNQNYQEAYTPQYPGSPATKKYVDDKSIYVGALAPANSSKGKLWYDSTNNVLKVYNGSEWKTLAFAV